MRSTILFLAVITFAIAGLSCGTKTTNNNSHAGMDHNQSAVDHSTMDHGTMDHSGMKSSPNAATAPYDLQFLDTMMAHHQGAVEMAGPCASKAQHTEVKTLCANIILSQQKEIAEMRSWRDKWFAGAAPAINMEIPGMQDSMKGMDMKKLGTLTGKDFDLEFIKQMTPHHEGAVVMAKEALQKSTKAEIKTLANAIIKAQESEIKQMKEWQTAWAK